MLTRPRQYMAQPGMKDDTSVTRDELDYRGLPLPRFSEVVRAPRVFTPPRRAGSVRRTMSIDATWPGGPDGHAHYAGRARDIVPHAAGDDPRVQRESSLLVKADARTIVSAVSAPRWLHCRTCQAHARETICAALWQIFCRRRKRWERRSIFCSTTSPGRRPGREEPGESGAARVQR
jgi:hypothetical protein